jgi:hypothetical protein
MPLYSSVQMNQLDQCLLHDIEEKLSNKGMGLQKNHNLEKDPWKQPNILN